MTRVDPPTPAAATATGPAPAPAIAPRRAGSAFTDGAGAPRRWWRIAGGLLIPLALLAAWWIITALQLLPPYRLPSPQAVWAAAVDLQTNPLNQGLLYRDIAISVQRVLLGFALGSLVGLLLGALVGLSRTASVLLSPLISALRAVPSLAWLPLLILYLGIFETPKVLLITIGAAFPVFTTFSIALRHVDPQLLEAGRAFGRTGVGLLLAVRLPAVLPALVGGLRLALAQAWLFLVAAELNASSIGLGFLLDDSRNNGRIDRLFLAIILLALFGWLTDSLVGLAQHRLLRRWV